MKYTASPSGVAAGSAHRRRACQDRQRHPQHPDALGTGLQRRVHLLRGLVGMRAQQMPGTPGRPPPGGVLVSVIVIMLTVLVLAAGVAGGVGMRVAHNPEGARKTASQHIGNSQRGAAATSSHRNWSRG